MNESTRTPEGEPNHCPICGHWVAIEPSRPANDAPCPHCGSLLWFSHAGGQSVFGFRRLSINDPAIRTGQQAIAAILDRLVEAGSVAPVDRPSIVEALLHREELGSTAIGGGVAVPHVRHPAVVSSFGAVAEFKPGIDFASLDGKPVHRVCLLLSPPAQADEDFRGVIALAEMLRTSA